MKKMITTLAILLSASACESEADVLLDIAMGSDDDVFADDEDRPVFLGGDAADDVPGCEIPRAFVANWTAFTGDPAWWAFDFSNCGPNPSPRLMVWESGDGYVCEQWIDPVGMECEIIVMNDCEKFADDTWHASLWSAGQDGWAMGYDWIAGPDYAPDSTLVCGAKFVGDETLWDCTGLPLQRPTCDPVTAG